MEIKEWISYLKNEMPRVISLGDIGSHISELSYISEQTSFKEGCLYVGRLSQVRYRFRFISHCVLFLLNDTDIDPRSLECGDNSVVIFGRAFSVEALYERCHAFLEIRRKVAMGSSILMEHYLEDASVQAILSQASELIHNPVMLIDINYRVLAYAGNLDYEDHQWQASIADGCCSYEFISQFNQLSEIRASGQKEVPFFAGCLISPMRRCISRIFMNDQHIGYLLSIESNSSFDDVTTGILNFVSRLLAKQLSYEALKAGESAYGSVWDILNYALEGRKEAIPALKEHLRESGFHQEQPYYLLEVNLLNYVLQDHSIDHINQAIHELFSHSVASYYQNSVVVLVQDEIGPEEMRQKLLTKKNFLIGCRLKVAVSDRFTLLDHIARYYKQVDNLMKYMEKTSSTEPVQIYEDIRFKEMLLRSADDRHMPLFIDEKTAAIRAYDKTHDADFFRTAYYYIKNGKSLQSTADTLFVHKNTISYRISRIKELFDLDLNDASVRIQLFMAYEAYELADLGLIDRWDEGKEND